MLFSLFLVCSINLGIAVVLLLVLGRVVRFSSRVVGLLLGAIGVVASAVVGVRLLALPEGAVVASAVLVMAAIVAVDVLRPDWNAPGQYFFASFVAAALAYLGFALTITVAGNLSFIGSAASLLLLCLETLALVIASSFAFETCDVICRTRHTRVMPVADAAYRPTVSVQIATYNEPPEMLIETIKALEGQNYPDFEIVIIDNNTQDESVWRPVADYCASRARVTFVHVDPWPGYKSGALNLALRRFTNPRAEIVAVVDSDYLVSPEWLQETVGYFGDPAVAFVQTPQDYRGYEGNRYLTACYDAYRYFFASAMRSRNERDSIIFAGTMGLLRRRALDELGGWSEWCITEDAEVSLRMLRAGWSGLYVGRSYGRGIMPLTYSSLKSQRFRWCFGGMQILRIHWRSLMPWDRSPENRLSGAQRMDYLFGGLQWLNDLILLGFAVVLLIVSGLLLGGSSVAIRPLIGPTIVLPAALLVSGLLRAVWALRDRTRISYERAFFAFANWLSLSWTVAIACLQGLVRREGVFLRTPKSEGERRLGAAVAASKTELVLTIALWGAAVGLAATTSATPLLVGLIVWQGAVYASSPFMAGLDQYGHLTPELERRRRTERRRERLAAMATPLYVGSLGAIAIGTVAFVLVVALGASHAGSPTNPLTIPGQTQTPPAPAHNTGGTVTPTTTTTTHAGQRRHGPATTTTTTSRQPSGSTTSTTSSTTPPTTATTTTPPTTTTTATSSTSSTTTSSTSP